MVAIMTEEKTLKTKQTKEQGNATKRLKTVNAPSDNEKSIVYKHDSFYRFVEPRIERCQDDLAFYPVYFLRTHSKNNDPADVQTQIWQCSFEPNPSEPGKFTNIVATCGGTSVCFISVKTGEVILKYNRNTKGAAATENLYALAWTSLPLDDVGLKRMNILATAGGKSTIIIIHPDACCCYQMFRTVSNKANAVVCSLLFHPKKSSWLFCGHNDGHIQLWDIGIPSFPKYDATPQFLFRIPAVGADVYNLVFSQTNDILIAGCDKGLFAWDIDVEKIKNNEKLSCSEFQVNLPITKEAGNVVDSICLIRDDILAFKCALHGFIYLCDLSQCIKTATPSKKVDRNLIALNETNLLKLKWSDTDNYYMNMGADPRSCTLVCGDDKGTLWIYDLARYLNGEIESPLFGGSETDVIEPDLKLDWPELEDAEVEKARKLRIDTYDIVVDKCTVSDGGQYIVAVTSNNMVCIWKRGEEDKEESDLKDS